MALVARGQAKLMKQVEGRGQYAHVVLRLTVDGPDTGVIIANSLLTHVIPAEYISPIEAGIRSVIDDGKLAERGYSGAHVELIDGSYHNVDSSNTAFFSAAVIAMEDALRQLPQKPTEGTGDDSFPGVRAPRSPQRPNPGAVAASESEDDV